MTTLEEIIDSYMNGQMRQMVEQIDRYGLYDIWSDLRKEERIGGTEYFEGMVITYHKIKYSR